MTEEEAAKTILSNFNLADHEAVHAVLRRVGGDDVWVVNQDDRSITKWTAVRPHSTEWDVMSVMGPEVYMTMHNIEFTPNSVSHDSDMVNKILADREDAEQFKAKMRTQLEVVFSCPYICEAIRSLAEKLFGYSEVKAISSDAIHTLIDPFLLQSPHADGLRERVGKMK
jgi:hypothetical protein